MINNSDIQFNDNIEDIKGLGEDHEYNLEEYDNNQSN